MNPSRTIRDRDGREATLEEERDGRAIVRLSSGERLDLPAELLEANEDGGYRLSTTFDELQATASRDSGERVVLREVEEHLHVGTRQRETGRVRATRRTDTREETVDQPVFREEVEIERVPINRYVDSVEPVREEEDVVVLPVYEEVLVVEKRLLLREEVRLTRRREQAQDTQRVTLRRSEVDVERVSPGSETDPPEGRS